MIICNDASGNQNTTGAPIGAPGQNALSEIAQSTIHVATGLVAAGIERYRYHQHDQ